MFSTSFPAYRRLLFAVFATLACMALFLTPQARAADFTVGAELNGGTATLWFQSTVNTSWVDAHYSVNGGAQQNVRMNFNSSKSRFETTFSAAAGQTVQHSFTYNNGGLAYDAPPTTTQLQGSGTIAAPPNFSPAAGSYTSAQSITLSSATSNAVIRYTTDGTAPTSASSIYSAPFTLSASSTNQIVRAYASADGMSDSVIAAANYSIGSGGGGDSNFNQAVIEAGTSATIWFSPKVGMAWVDVHFDSGTGQQNMRMVFNSASGRYEQALSANAGALIRYSFTYFMNTLGAKDSPAYSYTMEQGSVTPPVATPSFSPISGNYTSAQTVTLATSTLGATIRYTIDGSTPSSSSTIYSTPINVSNSSTIKALASKSGAPDSAINTASYMITPISNSFVQGVQALGASVTLWFKPNSAMNFVILHYRVGSAEQINPNMVWNANLARYETTINLSASGTILSYSFTYAPVSGNQADSPMYSYTIGADNGIAKPSFSPPAGSYTSAQNISLSNTLSGSSIRYTMDGTAANARSTLYTGPFALTSATTINAITIAADQNESAIASATYVISADGGSGGTVAAPVFSHPSGSYTTRLRVNLLSATVGATLRFTTDGSTPNGNSTIYGGPIEINSNTTVKAMAFKSNMVASAITTASYTLTGTGSSTWNGRTTFNLVNATKGRWANNQVYWAIIGKDWNSGEFVHVDLTGKLVPMSLGDNGALNKNGLPYTNYFYTLEQLSSVTIPPINSARLLMSVGGPMYIWVNRDGNGKIGYAGANIENPTDPNTDVTFDFGEFAILPPGASPQGIFINTTRVDQFGFPVQLKVTGLDGFTQTVGESLTESRSELFAKFIGELPSEFANLALPPYSPYRIMAPSHATFQTGGANVNYLDAYVTQIWNKYSNEDLVIDLKNGWAPFTGRVVGGKFRFTDGTGTYYINGKPSTSMVMLGNGLLDDPTGASNVGKQLQLQAQVCAALNRQVAHRAFADWWNGSYFYPSIPSGLAANYFAKFWHDHSLNALAYGFAYDDVGGYSPSIHTPAPVSVTYTIGW